MVAINNHDEHNKREDRHKTLGRTCDSSDKARTPPDTFKATNIMNQILNAPFLGCIYGLYRVFTPTTNDSIIVTIVPAIIIIPSLIILFIC